MIATAPASGVIKNRYAQLSSVRNQYRDRAREYAKVTLPYLLPENEQTASSEFQNDYNTEGAKLTNYLANKYVSSLFPAGRSFIKMTLDESDMTAQEQQGRTKAGILGLFATIERDFRRYFERVNSRAVLLDVLKHLIVTGNALIYKGKDSPVQNYALDEFVVLRDMAGNILEMITEDRKAVASLPEDIKAEVIAEMKLPTDDSTVLNETPVKLYTWIRRSPDNWDMWNVDQAVESVPVGESNAYKTPALRWIPVVWNRTRRESYGRGLVEEHFGSLWTLSILSEALATGCVTIADIKYLVKPGSLVDVAQLNAAASGSYHYGEPDDVSEIASNRRQDMLMIKDVIQTYKTHLGEVFQYLPSTMRDAERVTAEENRLRARELDSAHAGVYSSLATTCQQPYATLLLDEMEVQGLEESGVNLIITTGLDALSRGSDNDKINHWMADLTGTNSLPEEVRGRLKMSDFMEVTASGRDVDFRKFIMSDDEFMKMQQATLQAQGSIETQKELIKKSDPEDLRGALQQ